MGQHHALVVVTAATCGACEALKRLGAYAQYEKICVSKNVQYIHVNMPTTNGPLPHNQPPALATMVGFFPTIMLVPLGGFQWNERFPTNLLDRASVLNGNCNGAMKRITPLGQGQARVRPTPDNVAAWIDEKLANPNMARSDFPVYNSEARPQTPVAEAPATAVHVMPGPRFVPSTSRATSMYTGKRMIGRY